MPHVNCRQLSKFFFAVIGARAGLSHESTACQWLFNCGFLMKIDSKPSSGICLHTWGAEFIFSPPRKKKVIYSDKHEVIKKSTSRQTQILLAPNGF
ncbi:putative signal peptide protein [Puccinia sorghi]|uniref:Putative signal peptide protein n=1 Tax=Puccinia sorghi TaxID=27349 RepID=A0A0L6UGH3_9BASI|nr:putative signal peptide protein [Puccinia sorghi]